MLDCILNTSSLSKSESRTPDHRNGRRSRVILSWNRWHHNESHCGDAIQGPCVDDSISQLDSWAPVVIAGLKAGKRSYTRMVCWRRGICYEQAGGASRNWSTEYRRIGQTQASRLDRIKRIEEAGLPQTVIGAGIKASYKVVNPTQTLSFVTMRVDRCEGGRSIILVGPNTRILRGILLRVPIFEKRNVNPWYSTHINRYSWTQMCKPKPITEFSSRLNRKIG